MLILVLHITHAYKGFVCAKAECVCIDFVCSHYFITILIIFRSDFILKLFVSRKNMFNVFVI